MKKALCILIAVAVLAMASGCSSGNGGRDSGTLTTAADTSDAAESTAAPDIEPLAPELEALDYGNRAVSILYRLGNNYEYDYIPEELMNDPVSDSIYNSIQMVNEKLGVDIRSYNREPLNDTVGTMIASGDQTYDIVCGSVYYTVPMLTSGYMLNLLGNGIDTYLNTENRWWAQYWIEKAMLGSDRLYSITGASALSLFKCLFVTFYNKDLGNDLGIEDLYTVVDEGRWTLDYLSELVAPLYLSLNGDDVRDAEDRYGIIMDAYVNCDIFWSSCDITLFDRDEDGWYVLDTSDREKLYGVFDWLYQILYNNSGVRVKDANTEYEIFSGGNSLLGFFHLADAELSQFRNMQNEYGILPTPKYDEKQKEYYTYSHDQYNVFMIPKTVADPEMCGAVLEAMAHEYYYHVMPVYYDIVLKGRYANDPQSRRMLDGITANIKIDPGWIYAQALDLPCANVLRSLIMSQSQSFASSFASTTKKLPSMLKAFRTTFERFEY